MRLTCALVLAATFVGVSFGQQHRQPSGFTAQTYDEAADDYEPQAQTPISYRSRQYDYSGEDEQEEQQVQPTYQTRRQPVQQQSIQSFNTKDKKRKQSEEELEEEEPDRLSTLLPKSSFNCNSKTTGYYADESLGCEVFHYCQDNQKHSWICPEGFTFHQVHLICMPPSGENICEESSKYHIVNEYLYKPINVEEHETRPNVTLRYSERYYPDNYYHDDRQDYSDEREREQRVQSHRQPVQVGFQQRKAPTPAPSPLPYRFATQTQQPQQNVYRSPDEINISLQQRRPQIFISSTPKYTDDDYGYE